MTYIMEALRLLFKEYIISIVDDFDMPIRARTGGLLATLLRLLIFIWR